MGNQSIYVIISYAALRTVYAYNSRTEYNRKKAIPTKDRPLVYKGTFKSFERT